MTTRRTSAEAYAAIMANGRISECRKKVYRYLFESGPKTRNEIDQALGDGRPNPPYSRRLVEMESMGMLARVGTRKSPGGLACDLWDVTDQLPSSDPPKRSVQKTTKARAFEKLSKLLTGPRALVFPDATLRAAQAIIEGAQGEEPAR